MECLVRIDCAVSGHTRDGRYYRARYYHPALQRFISEDPIGFAGGSPNLYSYVSNDPINLIDPLGLSHEEFIRQVATYTDAAIRRSIKRFENNILEHLRAVRDPRQVRWIYHHMKEIRTFSGELGILLKEAAKRGIKLGGVVVIVATELAFPDEANAGEDELLEQSRAQMRRAKGAFGSGR